MFTLFNLCVIIYLHWIYFSDFNERSVMHMTLRNALIVMNLRINHPEILAGLKIANYEDLCIISLYKYFTSAKFHDDMNTAVLDIQEGLDHGYEDFVLLVVKNNSKELTLKVDLLDYYQDCIDTY